MSTAASDAAAPPARRRCEGLDGLRGLAALGIVVLHVWMFRYGDLGRPDKGFLDFVFGELRLGVQLFFVLSGFLVYRPFVTAALERRAGPGLGRYALRRAARILPGYWAAVAGSFLLLRHLGHPMQLDPKLLPVFLVFLQNHFDATIKHLDPPMWTLAVEVSFYALVPVVGALALRLGPHRAAQVALCLAVAAAGALFGVLRVEQHWPVTLSTSLLPHLLEFGAGMALAPLLQRRRLGAVAGAATAITGLALLVANSTWHALMIGPQLTRSLVGDAPGVLGMAMIVAVVVAGPWRLRALGVGPARWLGCISYGLYLAHFPVIVALRGTGHWPAALTAQLAVVLAVTVPIATALWLGVERPAIGWARRTTARRPAPGRRSRPARGVGLMRPQPAER